MNQHTQLILEISGTNRGTQEAQSTMKLNVKDLVEYYKTNPHSSMTEAGKIFGVSQASIAYHLKVLQKRGIVEKSRKWRSVKVVNSLPEDAHG